MKKILIPEEIARKNWKLVWNEEFDQKEIDRSIWSFEKGYVRNNELQNYTDRPKNARIEDSKLIIEAHKENFEGFEYTSASLNTRGTKSFKYGRIEMYAKLPYGQGTWPAFWTMGEDYGWPACGEIDIMEFLGGGIGDRILYSCLHWANVAGKHANIRALEYFLPEGSRFADDYHVIGIDWNEKEIIWYVDDVITRRVDITEESMYPDFHQPHFLLVNLAIGGVWPGAPDETTVFPQQYCIDWIRVYQEEK